MGDFRFEVKMSVIGADGEEYNSEMYVNWWPTKPSDVFDMAVRLARKAGLEVDDFYLYQRDRDEVAYYRGMLEKVAALIERIED